MPRIIPLKDFTGATVSGPFPHGLTADDVRAYCRSKSLHFHARGNEPEYIFVKNLDLQVTIVYWHWVRDFRDWNVSARAGEARALCLELPLILNRLQRAGCWKAAGHVQQAVNEIGWEAAALCEAAAPAPEKPKRVRKRA